MDRRAEARRNLRILRLTVIGLRLIAGSAVVLGASIAMYPHMD